jgi:hypothetical protein
MRHKSKAMFAALLAVLALGAVASASASAALPEFVPAEGGFPIKLEGALSSTNAYFSYGAYRAFGTCTSANVKGEITGAKVLSATLELKRCTHNWQSLNCRTLGAPLETEILSGGARLVYINKAAGQVGIVFEPTPQPVEFICNPEEPYHLRSAIVIPLTPLNTKTTTLSITAKLVKESQEFVKYENEKGEMIFARLEAKVLSGWVGSGLALGSPVSLTASKALTVQA